uniref:EF-hand domain-containing protein n=1 Tax=Chromera velia CCMP2878 TaxID=1169474 RepID=A0A0G4FK31_9ALVE|eukprot:Cvel_17365.t1-p1 / transcript=Cvel_17365.t1 / gene=Cvel_17365 / organism=Chromera_velia_CCMP2878 / gene_product=Calcineurin subunit B, putative / transcript_product=Calcineurin subunit B, putative / location=Cvel_scaffold1380:14716-23619(-) / protein_length=493 / sequence_SO=supercontig / SO=protein_coding / is_pseudo=false
MRGEFWEADVKEWAAILHTKTIGKRCSHLELAAVLNMGFTKNDKEYLSKGPGGRKKKMRIYVAGYDDLRKVDTFSGTPNCDCFLLTLLYVATRGFEVELVDIKNVFLQSPDDHVERVGVRIPKSIPTMPAQKPSFLTEYSDAEWGKIRKEAERVVPSQIYELSNALYGTPVAPALWGKELRRGQEELGFVPVEQSIAVRREVEDEPAQDVQATHVDDIFGAGERTEEAFDVLEERFKIGSRTKVNVGSKTKYIGIDMYHPNAHTFELTSKSYLEGIDVDAIPGKLKKSLSEKDVAPAEEQDMDMFLQGVYQETNGVLGNQNTSLSPQEQKDLVQSANFTERDIKKLYKRFQSLDSNRNGELDPHELFDVPEIADNPLVKRVISIFDTNRDGKVSFVEFLVGLAKLAAGTADAQKTRFAFEVYDINRDGYISNGELFTVMKMMVGSNLNDAQLQQLVDRTMLQADLDHDGLISFEEFQKVVAHIDISDKLKIEL